ncbi:MAG TPA: septum formation protein Maf [Phaeodactylibacter sp.]|nr:septum formation protein Maf [Phaeodactylibacter sp.]
MKKIILASKSPRRKQLLAEAGFEFEVKTREVDESYPPTLPAQEVAEYLAEKKAQGVLDFIQNDEIILTSDTTVVLGNTIFGKPKDHDDAFNILKQLSNKSHQVITGVCLLSKEKKEVFSSISTVYFDELSDTEIHYYINKFKPFDKAGAYAIQEWIGLCKINKIEGTYSNIMGLPMNEVYHRLINFVTT